MAVDKSTARGESLWNACCQGNNKSTMIGKSKI